MNLKEVLNYRNRCLMCYSKMELKAYDLAGITLHRTSEGLMIETGLKGMAVYFKFDGTYEKMKRWNNLYSKPMSLLKECPKCVPVLTGMGDKNIILKSRSVGITTIANMKDRRCAYTFEMWGDAEGNFDSKLYWEDIKYHNDEKFYHIHTKFSENRTEIKSASFKNDTIDSMLKLDIPAMKCNSIRTIDQLIHKIKTYMVFS